MHPSAQRLYLAAQSLAIEGQAAVARWLNEAPQTINNWEKRGVSLRGAIEVEKKSGCSAAWILEGVGERVLRSGEQASAAAGSRSELTAEERRCIRNLRAIADEAVRRQILEDIARRAERCRAARKAAAVARRRR
jgi:hypothetical protein